MITTPMELPSLPDAEVIQGAPAALSTTTCDRCGMLACRAVADVSWPNAHLSGGQDSITVGRGCIADVVALALEEATDTSQPIAIDVPTWRAMDIVALGGITYRQIDSWVRAGVLFPEPGTGTRGPGHERRFLTDEVWMAREIAKLVGVGLRHPMAARLLLDGNPDVASGLYAALAAPMEAAAA